MEPTSQGVAQALPAAAVGTPQAGRGLGWIRGRSRAKRRMRTGERVFLWSSRIIVWIVMFLILVPAVWVVGTSFQPGTYFTNTIFPTGFTLDHYRALFDPNLNVGFVTWIRNSVIVCTSVGVITVLLVATMAYAFSRFRFKGRKYGLMGLLLIQMFPAQMSFIAYQFLLNKIGLYDTLQGYTLVMIGGGLPFVAWLFKGYIDSLPRDLEEAAYVDGASKLQAYLRVILPLTRPMMAVVFLFTWFGLYSEYLVASFLLQNTSNYTMALGLHGFINSAFTQNWTDFAAAAVLGSLPLLIVFLSMQRFLVAGLSRGAVKG